MARQKEPGITRLKDGRYQARVTVGYKPDGSPVRRKRTCSSHAAARQAKDDLKREYEQEQVTTTSTTFQDFIEMWLRDDVKPHLKRNTLASYRQQCNRHILPRLGPVEMESFTPLVANRFASQLREANVPEPTQKYVLRVLSQICRRAVQLGVITRNPLEAVKRPTVQTKPIEPFTLKESQTILNHVSGQMDAGIYFLGLMTGMRMGEIFGLHWGDIDFNVGLLRIERTLIYGSGTGGLSFDTPKTAKGKRTIELPQRVLDELNSQRKLLVASGLAGCELVFPKQNGKPVHPPVWWRDVWQPLLKELGLKPRGFHHTRHTYATLAISEGVPITVVSKILGHANPKITLEIYAHALDEHQTHSVKAMQRLLG